MWTLRKGTLGLGAVLLGQCSPPSVIGIRPRESSSLRNSKHFHQQVPASFVLSNGPSQVTAHLLSSDVREVAC